VGGSSLVTFGAFGAFNSFFAFFWLVLEFYTVILVYCDDFKLTSIMIDLKFLMNLTTGAMSDSELNSTAATT
jgi:hypothetical protein